MDELRWATISEADHCCLTSKVPNVVKSRYHDNLAGVDEFYSDSASKHLVLYREFGVLKGNVEAGLEIAKPPEEQGQEQTQPHVFVFTGHRIDDDRAAKGKAKRFPKEMEPTARDAIKAAIVGELGAENTNAVGVAGGTEDMVEQARKRGAGPIILPTEQLFGLAG
ncbi:MAG: hypothetical protein QOJ70_2469 [Acidobacteriota bacterium]|jgi:hypothetical protein|nr:hypothetical protein [Acidobacteriota bacterium]